MVIALSETILASILLRMPSFVYSAFILHDSSMDRFEIIRNWYNSSISEERYIHQDTLCEDIDQPFHVYGQRTDVLILKFISWSSLNYWKFPKLCIRNTKILKSSWFLVPGSFSSENGSINSMTQTVFGKDSKFFERNKSNGRALEWQVQISVKYSKSDRIYGTTNTTEQHANDNDNDKRVT